MSLTVPQRRPLRIAVVENHPDTLRFFQMYLEQAGHSVIPARTLAEATERLDQPERCDMLISDVGLPDGSGWDLLPRLRAAGHEPSYAIAVSGYGAAADLARSREAGYRHHLLKPFDLGNLDQLLDEAAQARD